MTAVRPARPDELAEVGELTASAYVHDGFAGPDYAEVLRDAAARAAVAELLVAEHAGRLVGTVTLVPPTAGEQWRETDRPDVGTIRMLAVAPGARGLGIGRLLTVACLDRARAHGWRQVVLLTQPQMRPAHRIYEGLGFAREPGMDRRVSPTVELIGYALTLAG